jgi:CRISPR/Cas system CMR-associated protein Cmr3 (group 5 of RAMP superfamily)
MRAGKEHNMVAKEIISAALGCNKKIKELNNAVGELVTHSLKNDRGIDHKILRLMHQTLNINREWVILNQKCFIV